jgi:hypothetical protein
MDPPVTGHVVRFVEGGRPPPVAVNEAREGEGEASYSEDTDKRKLKRGS